VQLRPLDNAALLETATSWLSDPGNGRWLDVGNGHRTLTPAWLRMLCQRDTHVLRVFTGGPDERPVGLVALSSVDRHFMTATIWAVLGDKDHARRGLTTLATSRMLSLGFRELGLQAINTWVVDGNPSLHITRKLNFRLIGRQRSCHWMDGRPYDRLLFDLLASEHRELPDDD
jgi:RimJ/RimL family protein N-acetyltransferase